MEFSFKQPKTYRYEILKDITDATTVLYVLHGYGQLAKYFINKFNELDDDLLIVAPEGMHRFYRKGNSGRVGASWMTREARQVDIDDNMVWLTELDKQISEKYPIKNRIVLGFSQGGSTAARWRLTNNTKLNSLIVWGSDFPPEEENVAERLKGDSNNHFVVGTEDEFFDEARRNELIEHYESIGFKISTYIGHHDIDVQTLIELVHRIQQKL
ncbi:MAG: alpha/beta hydrolase [Crocinitomicaceae bacterium]